MTAKQEIDASEICEHCKNGTKHPPLDPDAPACKRVIMEVVALAKADYDALRQRRLVAFGTVGRDFHSANDRKEALSICNFLRPESLDRWLGAASQRR